MREYIFGTGGLAVVVVALCLGWPVYNSVAQIDDAADDNTLTVEQCIDATDDSADSVEEVLIEEDLIDEGLLPAKVTNDTCKDMLEPISDATLVRRLLAAQNYMQEIKLVKGAMREAAGRSAARRPDWHSSSDESLIQFRDIAQTDEQVAAQAQYDGDGGDGTGGIEPRTRQAAAALRAGEDADAPIDERLDQKEAALEEAGADVPEAEAGGLCGLQVEVSGEKLRNTSGLFEIEPTMPKKMPHRDTETAGLRISPATKDRLQEIAQQNRDIAEISDSDVGCVKLTNRMKADLITSDPEELAIDGHQPKIRGLSSGQATRWSWEITARKIGEPGLILSLSYAVSGGDSDFQQLTSPQLKSPPVYEKAIRVTPLQKRPWWQRIFERISEFFGV